MSTGKKKIVQFSKKIVGAGRTHNGQSITPVPIFKKPNTDEYFGADYNKTVT